MTTDTTGGPPSPDVPLEDPKGTEVPDRMPVVKQSIQDAVNVFLSQTGRNADEARTELAAFLAKIEPKLEDQINRAVDDPEVAATNLKYLWGMVYAETGRVSLKLIYQERQAITAIVITAIRTVIAMAVAA